MDRSLQYYLQVDVTDEKGKTVQNPGINNNLKLIARFFKNIITNSNVNGKQKKGIVSFVNTLLLTLLY
jgi:hypothetical protein